MAKSTRRRKLWVFGLIGLALVAMVVLAAFSKHETFITVQTGKVIRRDLTEIVVANGRIQPVTQVKISPEVSGEIIELPVKEGQTVKKGDLLVRIKPDFYEASRNSAQASFNVAKAGATTSAATLERAASEFKRNEELFTRKLISESVFTEVKMSYEIAKAQVTQSKHQIEMAKAALDKADEDLRKTTIYAPLDGTVSKLISQVGERVVGTAMMAGTDIMVISDLDEMEARVDIGEIDVVLIKPGQTARLEVDAFKDRKFKGVVTEIANSAKGSQLSASGLSSVNSQESTKFEVRIRLKEKEEFLPGMSVTAEIETRYRTNALTVPIAAVTTRTPKGEVLAKETKASGTNASGSATNSMTSTNGIAAKKPAKPTEVVFVMEGDHVKQVVVKIGIADDDNWEIIEGLNEDQEIVTGGYKAISRELEEGKKVRKGSDAAQDVKEGA
jgi:HlyD family secretion protein